MKKQKKVKRVPEPLTPQGNRRAPGFDAHAKKLLPSAYPVRHLVFVSPVGTFDDLASAIAACRSEDYVIGTGENIVQEWTDRPVSKITSKGSHKPKVYRKGR